MTNRGQWIFVLAIVGLLAGALLGGMALTPALAPIGVESKAPNFTAAHLVSGDTLDLDHYKGEVILLNVWATWCIPCEAEMPSIQRLHEEMGPEGLKIVAVSVDGAGPEHVREWVDERGLTFEILHDQSGAIERVYQTTGVPESFVIDREGVIAKKIIGATEWDHPTQKALLKELLASGTSNPE